MFNKAQKFQIQLPISQWAIVFSFFSLFILGLADNIRGPLFPEVLKYFNLNHTMGSWSFATTSMAAFISSYLTVLLLKKISLSQLLFLAVLMMSASLVMIGMAYNFTFFLIGCYVLGTSIGFMAVAQNLLITENIEADQRSRALSGLHAMYGLASFAAPLLASTSANLTGSWRAAFFITALVCLVYCLSQLVFISENKVNLNKITTNKEERSVPKIPLYALATVGGLFAFYVVAEILIGTRLALYMRTQFNMNLSESSRYVTFFFMFLLAGRLLFALKKINLPLKFQLNASLISSVILLGLGLKFHPFILTLVGLTMAPFYPLSVSYISDLTGIEARRFITFAMALQSLSVVAMHLGVGYLTDHLGIFYAFSIGIFALIFSLLCLNIHPKKLY